MTDMLQTAASWVNDVRNSHCADTVAYCHDNKVWHLRASRGETRYELMEGDGAIVRVQTVDFIVSASGFPELEPNVGDLIYAPMLWSSSQIRVYEVSSLGGAGQYERLGGTMIRIHTRYIDTTATMPDPTGLPP